MQTQDSGAPILAARDVVKSYGDAITRNHAAEPSNRAVAARVRALCAQVGMLFQIPHRTGAAEDAEGVTQIVVTHEMRSARDASDDIVEISDEDEIFDNPKDLLTRQFPRHFTTEAHA